MRDLTREEINDAPDWATHYYVAKLGGCDVVHYVNKEQLRMAMVDDSLGIITAKVSKQCHSYVTAKPIPRKQEAFDIYQAKASSGIKFTGANSMYVNVNYLEESVVVAKIDVIALAKHFNLTADDLK